MLIRPPVVREMRHDLWVKMTARPAPPTSSADGVEPPNPESRLASLKTLAELRESGVLSEEEFAREKARILS